MYLEPFLRYSSSNNGVTLKSGFIAELEIWVKGHWRSLKMIPFESFDRVSYLQSIVKLVNYGRILYRFWVITRYWSKIAIFSYPLHSMPPLGQSPLQYCHTVWCGKTRMVWLPDGEKKFEDMFSHVDRILACDRQTDRPIDGRTSSTLQRSPLCIRAAR